MSLQHKIAEAIESAFKTDALVVGHFAGRAPSKPLPAALQDWLKKGLAACPDFKGQEGRNLSLPYVPGLSAQALVVAGLGEPGEFTQRLLRKQLKKALDTAREHKRKKVAVALDTFVAPKALGGAKGKALWEAIGRTAAVAAGEAAYKFDLYTKGDAEDDGEPKAAFPAITWIVADAAGRKAFEAGLAFGQVVSEAQATGKDVMNLPPNELYPESMADTVVKTFKGVAGVKVEVFDEKKLEAMKVGGLIAVGRGSARPPRLVKITYSPARAGQGAKHYALVGKGITFDSGGISIKPSAAMDEMKFDMCGAGAVFAATWAIAKLKLPVKVTSFLCLAENMPGSRAQRPGDIIRIMDGQTVAVLNTDAEGRLVLADALVMASKLQPDLIIDLATLTGACVVALGNLTCGLLGHGEKIHDRIVAVGERIGERAWRLPLHKEYSEQIKYHVADIKNISGGKGGGTITAAAFLQRFVDKKIPWAHLDIAGTAWIEGNKSLATGFGIWLLTELAAGANA